MRKILFLGPSTGGKSTIVKRIQGSSEDALKTQGTEYYVDMADTPGELVEHWYFQRSLQGLANNVKCVAFVLACDAQGNHYPPNFARSFGGKTCIGIVTKIDKAKEGAIEKAREVLLRAGVDQIFETSSVSGKGIPELKEFIDNIKV